MNNNINNFNIEDTGTLITNARGKGRITRIILIVVAIIVVIASTLLGTSMIRDKRYNKHIEIAELQY